ncbi:methionyl-tRNA formyltransferase family protein, putative [Trichophyton verrucosum HKI 0517]|uniref:Methionyl-tRNA formyltransferase family protein, putative n=1 Tax=Trichophyton verrucosum (strain HKI 0517) TaxID=663202 RepID=D4D4T6_TRIVH|nr:methionyl-tRNA formyltransferase family protein, putative [Trichophyton verrucosum HKI 0517]EFE43142.1 methionyl-tRNA formyltransferase family protein, putative [Trichophyton verrucosum HKI 0517]
MLINGIRNRLFVPPLNPIIKQTTSDERELRPASKIKPENRHVAWNSWNWDTIRRHQIVLGALWNTAATSPTIPGEEHLVQRKRVIFGNMKLADSTRRTDGIPFTKPGVPFTFKDPVNKRDEGRLFVFTSDGKLLEIEEMKVEGDRMAPAYRAALKAKLVDPVAARTSMHSVFHGPLL